MVPVKSAPSGSGKTTGEPTIVTLLDYAFFWAARGTPKALVPRDLAWDRATTGKTRNVSCYVGSQLRSMFISLAGKVVNKNSFDNIFPLAHSKNSLRKIVRMVYQIAAERRVIDGRLSGITIGEIKAVDKVMADHGYTVEGSGAFC